MYLVFAVYGYQDGNVWRLCQFDHKSETDARKHAATVKGGYVMREKVTRAEYHRAAFRVPYSLERVAVAFKGRSKKS